MGCTRSLLKTWVKCLFVIFLSSVLFPTSAWAAFASQFSLQVGETYNDNIFFTKNNKETDFVTIISPTLSLYYAPTGQGAPTANLNISPTGLIYAKHSELNDFGFTNGSSVGGSYIYQYSPRLTFGLSSNVYSQGDTRLPFGNSSFQVPGTPTTPIPPQVPVGTPSVPTTGRNLENFISRGDTLNSTSSFQSNFQYRQDIIFSAGYTNTLTKFIQQGGTDWWQSFYARGIYNWRQDHNLYAGYTLTYTKSRNGDNGTIHNFDFGDDYFTQQAYKIDITPTLSLSASSGLSINTSSSGPRVANNTAITITKLWETASLAGGIRKGLTPSFGVSGVSDTTTLYATFGIQLAEKLFGSAKVDYSYYDTDDVNFRTLEASAGLSYWITTWLSSDLIASYRFITSGSGANNTDLLTRGTTSGSYVFLSLTARFDLWPNQGLARGFTSSTMSPVLRTPFPSVAPASTPTPSPSSTAPAKP